MNRLHAPHGLNGLHTSTRPAYAGHTSATAYATRLDLNTTNRPATRAWAGQGHAMSEHLPSRQFLRAGEELDAWRVLSVPHVVLSGVAISRRLIDEPEDLQLLQPGDLVGLETFQRRLSERRIQALIDCELAPLRRMSDAEWRELLLHALLRRETQPGLAALRVGPVGERVRRMLLLLGNAGLDSAQELELPSLASIAAVTASTNETVCRVVSHFRRSGLLQDAGPRRVRLMPGLQLAAGELPGGVTRSRSRPADTQE